MPVQRADSQAKVGGGGGGGGGGREKQRNYSSRSPKRIQQLLAFVRNCLLKYSPRTRQTKTVERECFFHNRNITVICLPSKNLL